MAQNDMQNNPGQTGEKKKMHPVKKFFRRVLLFFIILFFLAGIGTYLYYNYTYSEGYRAGMLLKFSHKGFVKTYEGELNLGGINPMPGNTIANNIWKFSVREDSVAQKLMGLEGKTIRVHYKEKVKSFFWQGETNYFVDEAEVVK
ncbi:MAG: hypothetical protein JWN78_2273 [Bacteroidota bacterium]|nr:hypothetical protein [Bacteroidota bacterium]